MWLDLRPHAMVEKVTRSNTCQSENVKRRRKWNLQSNWSSSRSSKFNCYFGRFSRTGIYGLLYPRSSERRNMNFSVSLVWVFPDLSCPRIPDKGRSFYYEENKSLEIALATAGASSFSQEPWRLRRVSF